MSNCPHQISLCKLTDCSTCQFVGDESRCPKAHSANPESATPTFKWSLGVIDRNRDICLAHRREVVKSVSADIRLVGLDEDCRLSMMTRGKFKTLIQLLEARGLSQSTVRGHLDRFNSLVADRYESVYEENGFELPAFPIPPYSVKHGNVQDVPERAISKFRKMMGLWASEGNTQLYIAAWFGLNCGMRWGDVCRITWSVFAQTIDGVFITYVPHKTEKVNGRSVSFRVDPEAYLDIEPYIGKPDSFVLIRHEGRGNGTIHGECANAHRSLHDRINAALKKCGIGTEANGKRFHALRKRFDTRNAQLHGEQEAARMAGHSVEIARSNYIGSASGRWK